MLLIRQSDLAEQIMISRSGLWVVYSLRAILMASIYITRMTDSKLTSHSVFLKSALGTA